MTERILETQDLYLQVPTIESAALRYLLDRDEDVQQYTRAGILNEEESKKLLLEDIAHYEKYGFTIYDLFEKGSNKFIGIAGVIHDKNSDNFDVELGYILQKEYWGKGYATQIAKALINYGFKELNLGNIIASCNADNEASMAILQKIGMEYKGPYPQHKNRHLYLINNIIITTENFYLRPFHEKYDFKLCYKLWSDKNVVSEMGVNPDDAKENIPAKLTRYRFWMEQFGFTNFAVFRKDTDEFVGSSGMSLFHDEEPSRNPLDKINGEKYLNQDIELGYVLHQKFWGKGYATELAKACIDFIFNNYPDIKRIVAVTTVNHKSSQNVLKKTGFKFVSKVTSDEYDDENFYVIYKP